MNKFSSTSAVLILCAASFVSNVSAAVTSTPSSSGSLPEVTTTASSSNIAPPGEYGNPGWTKKRRFATTRVFVQRDAWEVAVEQWYRVRTFDNKSTAHLFTEEIEIGLPNRVQLDFYYDWVNEKNEVSFKDFAFEARWALADWDVIPLNPTLYAEYKFTDADYGEDVLEFKLLLGDDIGESWQWGLNIVWEQELAGEKTTEWQAAAGLSYTINDTLSVGLESRFIRETVAGSRNDPEYKFLLGPSAQIRFTPNTHLDLVGLIGMTEAAPDIEGWVVFGIDLDFGKKASPASKVRQPVSGARD